ncbi:hypothetical protein H634G_00849 [Metarhizium anisopliae BRIP 53293]|uniref:GS catalytic domain-containing protein n=1 Tax=Metarhizium anisopliae BRIP 53293 TaxID=1291518 RepID=A0A0D9PC45_METAN|nr:hypothetical protein H634G_00849 [Metarhizium anisopliae BRIP 53293]KJK85417.1 hypothetical protein H633G_10737 [Metarhizium anisopliae BRIP 53284]
MDKLKEFLRANKSIEYIRIQWIDYSGVLRARFVPVARCLRIANGSETNLLPQRLPRNLVLAPRLVLPNALEQSSISIHHFHAEVQDQLEIALTPEPALQAVDSLVLAQETIRAICVRRNLKATMTPKPTLAGPSNGLHLHLSLVNVNVERVSADHFIAGVLDHMGSLCAFGMANYDGYARSVGDAAGAWIGFGTDNRDLPVRKISDWHWEFRMMDGTANPYLFAAAVLLAALDGLAKKTELVWKDCKLFPHLMNEKMRVEYGINNSMPVTFKEALDCLKEDAVVNAWIAKDLLEWYISVKEKEVEVFGKMTDEQRRLRFLEYF